MGRSENLYYCIHQISYFSFNKPHRLMERWPGQWPWVGREGQSGVRMELAWEDEDSVGWDVVGLRHYRLCQLRGYSQPYPLTTLAASLSPLSFFPQTYFLFKSLSCKIEANFLEHCVGKTRKLQARPNGMLVVFGLRVEHLCLLRSVHTHAQN